MTRLKPRALPLGAALALALLLIPALPATGQAIPGVPAGCCGYRDCRPASVVLLGWEAGKAVVRVDGAVFRIAREGYATNPRGGSWYCWKPEPECKGIVSEECAQCAVETAGRVRLNPMQIIGHKSGTRYFIAEQKCERCHR